MLEGEPLVVRVVMEHRLAEAEAWRAERLARRARAELPAPAPARARRPGLLRALAGLFAKASPV